MTKKVILYTTSGNLGKVMTASRQAHEDGFINPSIEYMKLFVDKERGVVRLIKRTVSGIHKRFLWVVDDPVLTGEIHSLDQRKEVILHLYNKGLTQSEIANFINVSQALVSKDLTQR